MYDSIKLVHMLGKYDGPMMMIYTYLSVYQVVETWCF